MDLHTQEQVDKNYNKLKYQVAFKNGMDGWVPVAAFEDSKWAICILNIMRQQNAGMMWGLREVRCA